MKYLPILPPHLMISGKVLAKTDRRWQGFNIQYSSTKAEDGWWQRSTQMSHDCMNRWRPSPSRWRNFVTRTRSKNRNPLRGTIYSFDDDGLTAEKTISPFAFDAVINSFISSLVSPTPPLPEAFIRVFYHQHQGDTPKPDPQSA